MHNFLEAVWLVAVGLPVLLVNTLTFPASYLIGLGYDDDEPIYEHTYFVSGPRYSSINVALPFTDESLWYYTGDEPDMRPWAPHDPDTYALKITDVRPTYGLKGSENGDTCQGDHY